MNKKALQLKNKILNLKNQKTAKILTSFFQTNPGSYGEGDLFLGIKTPPLRKLVKDYYNKINLTEIQPLLKNKYHEVRTVSYLILVEKYQKAKNLTEKIKIVNFYLNNLDGCNNWDLVDLTCYKIIGDFLTSHPQEIKILYFLNDYQNLWTKRIAIVANMTLVKKLNNFTVIKKITENLINNGPIKAMKNPRGNKFISNNLEIRNLPKTNSREFILNNQHLLFKASGWILREMGKSREEILINFLTKNYSKMPSIMFSYAKEKLDKRTIEKIKF
jgi:3-methyladenine DNA glycosylase AlkD